MAKVLKCFLKFDLDLIEGFDRLFLWRMSRAHLDLYETKQWTTEIERRLQFLTVSAVAMIDVEWSFKLSIFPKICVISFLTSEAAISRSKTKRLQHALYKTTHELIPGLPTSQCYFEGRGKQGSCMNDYVLQSCITHIFRAQLSLDKQLIWCNTY